MIVIRRIVAAWLLLGFFSIHAEAGDAQKVFGAGMLYIVQDNGLVANMPAYDTLETLQHVKSFQSDLTSRQARCAEDMEKTRFKTHDTLITIIMPGGLLYAMNKQQRHEESKQAYAETSKQLEDLQDDMARLQMSSSEETFALLN